MSKNLSKHKIVVKTRECIIQAIYQIFMEDTIVSDLIDQFRAEVNEKKIDYELMKKRLDNFEENKIDFTALIEKENSNEQLQIIDKSILAYALVEKNINEIPKEVVIDECIRLAKKFSNEKAYKYVNAKADILYDL